MGKASADRAAPRAPLAKSASSAKVAPAKAEANYRRHALGAAALTLPGSD